jgi:hypothetical protein
MTMHCKAYACSLLQDTDGARKFLGMEAEYLGIGTTSYLNVKNSGVVLLKQVCYHIFSLLCFQKNFPLAKRYLERAVDANPQSDEAWNYLGICDMNLNLYSTVIIFFPCSS